MANDRIIYPILKAKNIKNPSKLYAFPLIGGLIKIVMLIPVIILLIVLSFVTSLVTVVNSFVVLFSGTYWKLAFDLNLDLMRYTTKMSFFFAGITNKYPGFQFAINDDFSVEMPFPASPNRVYAIPFFGAFVRGLLLIPFTVFMVIVQSGAGLGVLLASFAVLFKGHYPESMFEFWRDYTRLQLSQRAYISGLSDEYPSFSISWNHKTTKILLIVLALLVVISRISAVAAAARYENSHRPRTPYYQTLTPALKQQIIADVKSDPLEADEPRGEYTVQKISGAFARGTAPTHSWIAESYAGVWEIIWKGQESPKCSEMDTYQVPQTIYGHCLEDTASPTDTSYSTY